MNHHLLALLAPLLLIAGCPSGPEADTTPPEVVKLSPPIGATDVDPALKELKVTFNESMKGSSWSWVQESPETAPKLGGEPKFDPTGRINTVPVTLEPGREYVIWLNSKEFSNFADVSGNVLVPVRWTFRTKGEAKAGEGAPDAAPAAKVDAPKVTATSPANGAVDVPPGKTTLTATFDRKMKDKGWSWVMEPKADFPAPIGEPSFDESFTKNSIEATLEPGKTYVIWLNSERFKNFQDEAGIPAEPFRWSFTTAAAQ
ncbi:MAG: Ig-like domain-containing protein [Deltaproteobacteria bacterium]|nr:Ig-like domain-containing protein [Deltaproteobacteria bacterium]